MDTAWAFFLAGGPVMWPLLCLSLWIWALIIYKALWLVKVRREGMGVSRAMDCLISGHLHDMQGPRGRALAHFLGQPARDPRVDLRLWRSAVQRQVPLLWRQVDTILVLAAVAPLLGLLGTVSGMIETFQVICEYGTGNAQALAAGIREALITTETGLLIAIPGLLAGYVLRRLVRKEQQGLDGFAQAVGLWLKSREASCSV